jgi:hypothetical protein
MSVTGTATSVDGIFDDGIGVHGVIGVGVWMIGDDICPPMNVPLTQVQFCGK